MDLIVLVWKQALHWEIVSMFGIKSMAAEWLKDVGHETCYDSSEFCATQ